jgi:hypothetical protein
MAKPKYSDYCGHHKITREPLKLGSDAPFFKDGKLNRDPHAAPSGPAVIQSEANYKRVDVFHHRADKD